MIPAVNTSSVLQAVAHGHGHKPHAGPQATASGASSIDPTSSLFPSTNPSQTTNQPAASPGGTGMIGGALGQLTTEAMQLLGAGIAGPGVALGAQAAQAYAASNGLSQSLLGQSLTGQSLTSQSLTGP